MKQPRGPLVGGPQPARPEPVILTGRFASLHPLDPAKDARDLFSATHGEGRERVWTYLSRGPYPDAAALEADITGMAAAEDRVMLAVRDPSGRTRGRTGLVSIDPLNRRVETGATLFEPGFAGGAGATEAMFLLLAHVFEDLGYRRLEGRADALNAASRRFMKRLGYRYEGLLRRHMILKYRSRDTACYAILAEEWPRVRRALELWLDPDNFDDTGRQRRRLEDIRAAI